MSVRTHARLDNSCSFDSEELPGRSRFMEELTTDMGMCSLAYLTRHYPELIFRRMLEKKKPKGHDIVVSCPKGYVVADWRVAALP